MKPLPSLEEITAQVSYDPETGQFVRLVNRPNSPAGTNAAKKLDTHGYPIVRVCGREFRAHRLAWIIARGNWPAADIDHINRNRTDNRIANLREATRRENLGNSSLSSHNTSGIKGVHLYKATGRWSAYINVHGKRKHLGYFDTCELAGAAYREAAKVTFGEFAHVG